MIPPDLVSPIISLGVVLITVVGGGIFAARNRKKGAVEGRAPSALQAWEEADQARGLMRWFEGRFYRVLLALQHLMRDILLRDPSWVFSQDVEEASKLGSPEEEAANRTSGRTTS